MLAVGALFSTPVGLVVGHAVPSTRNPMTARLRLPALSMVETFTSEGAKTQVGNNAFLNEDLMGRAIRGPGVVSKSKLKIAVVGAGLAGMFAAMDLVDAGHDVELFELRPFVGGKVSSWKDNPNPNPSPSPSPGPSPSPIPQGEQLEGQRRQPH